MNVLEVKILSDMEINLKLEVEGVLVNVVIMHRRQNVS